MAQPATQQSTERRFRLAMHTLGAATIAAAATLVVSFVALPQQARQAELQSQIADTRQFLASSDRLQTQQQELRERVARTGERLARIAERMPTSASESEFLAQLSQLAKAAAVSIHEFRPGSTTEHATHRELEISVAATGDYSSLCEFLAGLSDLPRLSRVKSLTVNRDATTDTDIYPVQLTLVLYYQPQPLDSGDADHADV